MLRFLSIDDSRTVHAFLRACFQHLQEPVELSSAMDGQEAVDRLAAGSSPQPDLIFLDWEMPRLNGPETFARLRAIGVSSPVIMLTSKNDVDDIMRMLEAGVAEYVMKPFTSDILREKVGAVLGVELAAGSG